MPQIVQQLAIDDIAVPEAIIGFLANPEEGGALEISLIDVVIAVIRN